MNMIANLSFSGIAALPWAGDAHYLRGLPALACLLQPAMLPGLGHERQADKRQWKREDDFCGKEDFCSLALAGSGDM